MLTRCVDVNVALMVSVKDVVQRGDGVAVGDIGDLDGRSNVHGGSRDGNESAGKEGDGGEMHCV